MSEKAKFVQLCCDFYNKHSESDKQWFARNYEQCDEPYEKNNLCMHKWQFPLFVLRAQQAEIEELYPEKPQAALTNDDLEKIGFFKHSALFTLGNTMRCDLGRDRYLKAICVGTRNEMVFLCADEEETCSDLICVHNFDYDGLLTIKRIKSLIDWFGGEV